MLPHYQRLPFVKRVTLDECNQLIAQRQRVSRGRLHLTTGLMSLCFKLCG